MRFSIHRHSSIHSPLRGGVGGSLLLCLLILLSCKSQYMVKGSSSVDELEGRVLTLKVYADGEMKSIDSTRVVHGRFSFGGGMDSTMLGGVFLDGMSLMPIASTSRTRSKLLPALRSTTRWRASYCARRRSMHVWPSCRTWKQR